MTLRPRHWWLALLEPRPLAPSLPARSVEAINGRARIKKINGAFLYRARGSPDEYKRGLDLAIAKGWLTLHESGTYVTLTEAGAALFA
jgi:hypothetical protein